MRFTIWVASAALVGAECLSCGDGDSRVAASGGTAGLSAGARSASGSGDGGSGHGGAAAEAGQGGGASSRGATFTQVAALLKERCTACHAPIASGLIDFTDDDGGLYARLTTPLPTEVCMGKTLADQANPAASLLPIIVQPSPPCAARMPAGCITTCLKAPDIAVLQSWVDAGSLEN